MSSFVYQMDLESYLKNYIQSGDAYTIAMNSEHISKFEKALDELVFKELKKIIDSDVRIPKEEKVNCLMALKMVS